MFHEPYKLLREATSLKQLLSQRFFRVGAAVPSRKMELLKESVEKSNPQGLFDEAALKACPKTPFLENAVLLAPHFPKLNWGFRIGSKRGFIKQTGILPNRKSLTLGYFLCQSHAKGDSDTKNISNVRP